MSFFSRVGDWLRIPAVSVSLLALSGGALIVGVGRIAIGSWFVPILIALGAILLGLIVFVVWAILSRENERRYQAGIRSDGTRGATYDAPPADPGGGQQISIESRFARGLEHWQQTPRARALPWYLMIGAPGAGKTSVLAESGLEVPAETARLLELGPTQKCAWWPSNQAIVIDTEGRYLAADESAERKEWRTLLRLIRRHGHRVPIQGVLVAVSLPSILGRSEAEVEAQAHLLRRRLNEISTDLGVDAPVYVLITHADTIEGLAETATSLPQSRLNEAFGWTNAQRIFHNAGESFERGFGAVIAGIEKQLPDLVMREQDATRRRKIFLFPEELRLVSSSVAGFLRRAFGRSAYGEVPFLRGVYFTSAQQGGATISPLLARLGHGIGQGWAQGAAPGGSLRRNLFLRDLFRSIIVNAEEQTLAAPARELPPTARRITLGLCGAAALLMVGLWTNAFARGYGAVDELRDLTQLGRRQQISLGQLDEMRGAILGTDDSLESFWRRLGLAGPIERASASAKQMYASQFGRNFESPIKTKLIADSGQQSQAALNAVVELAKDVAFLKARGPEATVPDLESYAVESGACRTCGPSIAKLPELYTYYVKWADSRALTAQLQNEQDQLQRVSPVWLKLENIQRWCRDSTTTCQPIQFETASLGLASPPTCQVQGAYTRRVWKSLIEVMVEAVEGSGQARPGDVERFVDDYWRRYEQEWREMLRCVPDAPGVESVPEASPYVGLLNALGDNTTTDGRFGSQGPPAWFGRVQELMRSPQPRRVGTGDDSSDAPTPPPPPAPVERYLDGLRTLASDVARARNASEFALQVATETARGDANAFVDALRIVDELVPIQVGGTDRAVLEDLRKVLRMPALNAFSEVLSQAARELDQTWRREVVDPFSGRQLNYDQLRNLYGPGPAGAVARFEDGPLLPFWDGEAKRVLADRRLPLGPEFVRWMAAKEGMGQMLFGQAERIVRVRGVPPRLDGPADLFVTRQILALECLSGRQEFIYEGGGGGATFRWTPQCSDVSIRVWVRRSGGGQPETELRGDPHEWRGPMGFNEFLREGQVISSDRLRWKLDFPRDGASLIVTYEVEGEESIRPYRHTDPPQSIRN